MPPKENKAGTGAEQTLAGFEAKEIKLLAAAFVSSIGPDKYDYDLMATLTGNTNGSLKKMFPPVKRKAAEAHPSFAAYLAISDGGVEPKAAPKSTANKKRKLASDAGDADTVEVNTTKETEIEPETKKKSRGRAKGAAEKEADPEAEEADPEAAEKNTKKKAPAKGRGRPKKAKSDKSDKDVKKEPTPEEAEDDEI